jgi:hypothetical protein
MKRFKRNLAMILAMLMVIGTQSISVLADETDAGADETVGTEEAMTNEEAATQETLAQGGIETYADNYVGDDVYGVEEVPTSGTCGDNLTWTLSDDGTLTITGSGAMRDYANSNSPFYANRENIKKVIIEEGVTSIGEWAFSECDSLKEIIIPNSVSEIDPYSFYYCNALEEVYIPAKVRNIYMFTFGGCSNLREAYISEGVETIGRFAFDGCGSLVNVNIPNSVTVIENDAFAGCSSLPEVRIPSSVSSMQGGVFANCSSLSNIYFEGDAPQISDERTTLAGFWALAPADPMGAFSNVTANVHYPMGNSTWTADNMLDYGGNLTWIAQNPADELVIVLDVTDKEYLIGSGSDAAIKCTGELKDFVSVAVDGVIVDSSNYMVVEGSTVLTFLSSYLDTLSVGDHVVTLNYTYGSIDTTLTILDRNANDGTVTDNNQNTDAANNGGNAGGTNNAGNAGGNNANKAAANGVPKTGDATPIWLLCFLCVSSGIGFLLFVVKKKKTRI